MASISKPLLVGAVIIFVLGGIYIYFFSGGQQLPITQSAPAGAAEQQFLDLAGELQPVSFDTALFSDPRFASLVDLGVPIAPEVQGRTDPFAPIPGVAPAK